MDAATAAAMSDPERNRFFRRRWVSEPDDGPCKHRITNEPHDSIDLTGLELLQQWRREREAEEAEPRGRDIRAVQFAGASTSPTWIADDERDRGLPALDEAYQAGLINAGWHRAAKAGLRQRLRTVRLEDGLACKQWIDAEGEAR